MVNSTLVLLNNNNRKSMISHKWSNNSLLLFDMYTRRSSEKDSFHFSSANSTNPKTGQITTDVSCTEVKENSAGNGTKTSENEVNQTQAKVVTKRKRGRPRKADQIINSPLAANGQGEVISGTLSLSQTVINTGDNPEGRKLDNESSDSTVTPRRASTRVRTPRINLNLYDDAEENKRKRKRVKSDTPKKRGRKPKIVSDENAIDDSVRDSDYERTHGKKPGRKQKSDTAENECDIHVGTGTKENVGGNSDNVDDENEDVHDDNAENVDNEDDDDDDDDEDGNVKDDGNGTCMSWCIHCIFPPVCLNTNGTFQLTVS